MADGLTRPEGEPIAYEKQSAVDFLKGMVPSTIDAEGWTSSAYMQTNDGWVNPVTGMGINGRDKAESMLPVPTLRLSYRQLDSMYREDGFTQIIVDSIVDDALRNGWTLKFKSSDGDDLSPDEASEINERVKTWYRKVKIKPRISQHLKQARLYGGAILALGVTDGQRPDRPVRPNAITSFNWMRSHDRTQVSMSAQMDRNPRSLGFGFPDAYMLYSAMQGTQPLMNKRGMLQTWVHNSRVWRTDGPTLSERVRLENQGWGESVIEPCKFQLGNRDSVMKAARTVVQEWVLGVYKIKNLKDVLYANGEDKVRGRFGMMDMLKSQWQSVFVDSDNEDFQRIASGASGMPEMLDRFGIDLAAVARMPMTKLFGLSPGGFGTGEAEGDNWDDRVKAYQQDYVLPMLEYIHRLLFLTPEFREDVPPDWSIEFNPLQLTDPLEEADLRLKTSQADALDISSGVLGPDEVANSRYSGAGYSTDTQLDHEQREMDDAIDDGNPAAFVEAPGQSEESGSGISVIGEKINDVLAVLDKVSSGALSDDAAIRLLVLSYPTVDEGQLRAMVTDAASSRSESQEAEAEAEPNAELASGQVEERASGSGEEGDDDESPEEEMEAEASDTPEPEPESSPQAPREGESDEVEDDEPSDAESVEEGEDDEGEDDDAELDEGAQ